MFPPFATACFWFMTRPGDITQTGPAGEGKGENGVAHRLLREDVADFYVSAEAASREYGVAGVLSQDQPTSTRS
jgi:hypothetical protein